MSRTVDVPILDQYHPLDYDENGNVDGSIRGIRSAEKAFYVWQLAQDTGNDDVFALFKGPIHSYDDGVWREDDRQHLREISSQSLTSSYSKGVLDEIEERVRVDDTKHVDELGAPDGDRKSTRLNSSHVTTSRMPSSA